MDIILSLTPEESQHHEQWPSSVSVIVIPPPVLSLNLQEARNYYYKNQKTYSVLWDDKPERSVYRTFSDIKGDFAGDWRKNDRGEFELAGIYAIPGGGVPEVQETPGGDLVPVGGAPAPGGTLE